MKDNVSSPPASVQTAAIRNDKVIVTDCVLGPSQQLAIKAGRPSVIVYFTYAKLQTTPQGGKTFDSEIKKGAALFDAGTASTVQNAGTADVRFLRIEFVGSGLDETWGRTGISPNYGLLLENRYVRIYDIRIAAGTKEPLHTHHARVAICLSGAKMSHLLPDGCAEPSGLKSGTFAWRPGQTHVGQNLDTTDLWVIAVEPK